MFYYLETSIHLLCTHTMRTLANKTIFHGQACAGEDTFLWVFTKVVLIMCYMNL